MSLMVLCRRMYNIAEGNEKGVNMTILAKRIRYYRQKAGISQADMARKLGLIQANYSKYETGSREPRGKRVEEIAEALGIEAEKLLYGEGQGYFNLLNSHLRRCILGDADGFKEFMKHISPTLSAEKLIRDFFQSMVDAFEEGGLFCEGGLLEGVRSEAHPYNKMVSLLEDCGSIDAPCPEEGGFVFSPAVKTCTRFSPDAIKKTMFCAAVNQYVTENGVGPIYRDVAEYHGVDVNVVDEGQLLKLFTMDLYGPYLAHILDSLHLVVEDGGFMDEFGDVFKDSGLMLAPLKLNWGAEEDAD